ncbi:U3 small nucleolar RNA-associated protein 7 [Porphyridium purpureum]|uniref:U3 small nucleolar RNA-associated protein 7 n=1 Tax=Porphyridium purpureum TaxID=35688 RepID=A0A5J4YNS4_PORPP|nr:U3 small nucleolar RNA-associated protein 7 [Porphyridium purpureum]|eukprot:POR7753..scf222_8
MEGRVGDTAADRLAGEAFTRKKLKGVADLRLKRRLDAATRSARAAREWNAQVSSALLEDTEHAQGFIEAETPLERTVQVSQQQLRQVADVQTARRAKFALQLADTKLGPYGAAYSRNSNHLLVYGQLGHVATIKWKDATMECERFLNETVRHGIFLHSHNYFALAQRKYVYIYDSNGVELHCMKQHLHPSRLAFLPNHFLLASVNDSGKLTYSDTSSGEIVAELRTKSGRPRDMSHNSYNGCIHVAQQNGVVSIWAPTAGQALAKVLCHKGPVSAVSVFPEGHCMATAGDDGSVKVWDLRMWKALHEFSSFRPASMLATSHSGLLAAGMGSYVTIWNLLGSKKRQHQAHNIQLGEKGAGGTAPPYLKHLFEASPVESLAFCPYEDFLGVGHASGFASLIVPGAGEVNWDSRLPNQFETKRQRREREVTSLLDKLGPETIALNPGFVGEVDKNPKARLMEVRQAAADANAAKLAKKTEKSRARGRNKIAKKIRRKQKNVIDERSVALREKLERQKHERERKRHGQDMDASKQELGALARFAR